MKSSMVIVAGSCGQLRLGGWLRCEQELLPRLGAVAAAVRRRWYADESGCPG